MRRAQQAEIAVNRNCLPVPSHVSILGLAPVARTLRGLAVNNSLASGTRFQLMRWKVLILTSLAAAIAGVGLALIITLVFFNALQELLAHAPATMAVLAILFLAIAFAGFFVYRHTARRRKLQTALAVLLTFLLATAGFALGSMLTPKLKVTRIPATRSNR